MARSARADSASPPQRAPHTARNRQSFTKPLPKSAIAPLRRSNIATRTGGGVRGWTDIISRLEIGRDASTIARRQQNDGTGRKERTDGGALGCLNSRAEVVTNAPRRAEPNGKMIRRAKGAGRLRIAQSPRKLKLQPRKFGVKRGILWLTSAGKRPYRQVPRAVTEESLTEPLTESRADPLP